MSLGFPINKITGYQMTAKEVVAEYKKPHGEIGCIIDTDYFTCNPDHTCNECMLAPRHKNKIAAIIKKETIKTLRNSI
jgi:hypothetical protein